jgi:membrane-associated two-gene conflict system component 1 (EACC1)
VGRYETLRGEEAGDARNLLVQLQLEPDADPDEPERFGRQLRAELAQLDVTAVGPVAGAVSPPGAKGDAVDWGSLLVTFSAAGGVFTSLIAVLRAWLVRHSAAQSIKITIDNDTIELGRASEQEREALIDSWVRRHSAS